jgi:hypothetical protein
MLRTVIIQLWNRRRSNLSIILELLCVFCLMWYITDYLFVYAYNCSIPSCRDINHAWQVKLSVYPSDYSGFRAEEDTPEARLANFDRVLRVLRDHPDVEATGISSHMSVPGSGSLYGRGYMLPEDTANMVGGQMITLSPLADFFRVFGYTRDGGRTPVSMHDFDWSDPGAIVISRSVERALFPGGENAVGSELAGWDRNSRFRIVGVVDDIKRFEYLRPQHAFYLPLTIDGERFMNPDASGEERIAVFVRSRASVSDSRFRENFMKEMGDALQIGNFYLDDIVACSRIEADVTQRFGYTNEVRVRIYLMVFFLLNILLCVLGTFWYKVNIRRSEIGLRKAMGSSKRNVRNRFFLEGICLLAVAAVFAMIVEIQFVKAGLIETLGNNQNTLSDYLPDRTLLRFLITNAITAVTLSLVILGAIWLPARRAAAVPPVDALRDE